MLIEVREFCHRVESDLAGLIDELPNLTGRYGPQERQAWERSLPKLSVILARPQLASLLSRRSGLFCRPLQAQLAAGRPWHQ